MNEKSGRHYGLDIDPEILRKTIDIVKEHEGSSDLVERCNIFDLPLKITAKTRNKVFYAALAELCTRYTESSAAKNLMEPFFGRGALDKFRNDDGDYDFSVRDTYPPHAIDMIISMAYPWFSRMLFMSLFRINLEDRLDVLQYARFAGEYRYFRAYPLADNLFVLRDGRLRVEVDRVNNLICFGHTSQNWRGGNFSQGQYEHRGFVIPGQYKTDLISFRGSITRFASIAGKLDDETEGTILTHTRGRNNKPPRPFVAQFLLFKKGHRFEGLDIPTVEIDEEVIFDENSEEYKVLATRFMDLSQKTVSSDFGFMWGSSAETAQKASKRRE